MVELLDDADDADDGVDVALLLLIAFSSDVGWCCSDMSVSCWQHTVVLLLGKGWSSSSSGDASGWKRFVGADIDCDAGAGGNGD